MPDFIKIDVEGYEDMVMRGLSAPVKALCFEFTPEHLRPAMESMRMLEEIARYEYNFSLGETMTMALDEWMDAKSAILEVDKAGVDNVVYGDIYARLV